MSKAAQRELAGRLARGEYVVDPRAVAEAILRRRMATRPAPRLSGVLVPAQVPGPAARVA